MKFDQCCTFLLSTSCTLIVSHHRNISGNFTYNTQSNNKFIRYCLLNTCYYASQIMVLKCWFYMFYSLVTVILLIYMPKSLLWGMYGRINNVFMSKYSTTNFISQRFQSECIKMKIWTLFSCFVWQIAQFLPRWKIQSSYSITLDFYWCPVLVQQCFMRFYVASSFV